jgi:hypothetical protein
MINPALIKMMEYCHSLGVTLNYTNKFIDEQFKYIDRVPVLDWLVDHQYPIKCSHDAIDTASSHGNINLLQWMYNANNQGLVPFEYTDVALNSAPNCVNAIKIIKWWISHSEQLELKYDWQLFAIVNMPVLRYLLHEQTTIKIIINRNVIDNLSDFGRTVALDMLYELRYIHDFSCGIDTINNASENGNVYSLKWWFDKANEINLPYSKRAIDRCNRIAVLNIWFENRHILPMKYTHKAINEKTVAWWYQHRDDLELKINKDKLREIIDHRKGEGNFDACYHACVCLLEL